MRTLLLTLCLAYSLSSLAAGDNSAIAAGDSSNSPVFAQSAYEEIQRLEQEFQIFKTSLLWNGFTTDGFYRNVVTPLNNGAELNQDYLEAWEQKNAALRINRFEIWIKKQFYIIALIHAGIHQAAPVIEANEEVIELTRKRFKADVTKLDNLFNTWEKVSQYPQEHIHPKEQKERLAAFYNYLEKAREILQYLGQAPELAQLPPSSTALKGALRMTGALSYLTGQLIVRNSATALNYLNPFHYILPQEWRRSFRRLLFKNHTPLNTHGGISNLFKGLKESRGYQVDLLGRENLDPLHLKGLQGQKIVNLFLPSHRNDMADTVLMSRLGEELGSFLMFANPSAFAPNYAIGQMLASLPEFISVGRWRGFPDISPTDKLLKSLEQRRSSNVVNYPQGFLSSMGEVLPINASFVEKLLTPLLDRGFEVNIIPISYEVDSHFLSKTGAVDDLHIQARLHPPLLHSTVKVLVEKQLSAQKLEGDLPHTRYFDHFLATLWIESIQEHNELSLDEMLIRTKNSLGISASLD